MQGSDLSLNRAAWTLHPASLSRASGSLKSYRSVLMVKLNVMDRKVLLWCVLGQWVITSLRNSISMENSFSLALPLTKTLGSWLETTTRWREAEQSLKMCQCVSCISASLDGDGQACFLFAFFYLFFIDLKNFALKPHFWSSFSPSNFLLILNFFLTDRGSER